MPNPVLSLLAALPVSGPMDPPPCFDTLHAAVDAAAHAALEVSKRFEVGGAIYALEPGQASSRFCHTQPVTAGRAEEIDYRVQMPQGAQLAALWHTHPTGAQLSDNDRALAKRMHLPMYVVLVQSHVVIGAENFALDQPPVHLEFVTFNGVRYIKRGPYYEAPNGHLWALSHPVSNAPPQ